MNNIIGVYLVAVYLIAEKKVGEKWLNILQVTKFFLDFLFPDQYFSPIFFTWQRIYPDFSYPKLLLLFPIYLQNLLLPIFFFSVVFFLLMYFKHFKQKFRNSSESKESKKILQ